MIQSREHEQIARVHAVFIQRSRARRRQSRVFHQLLAVIYAERCVRVANVNYEKHIQNSELRSQNENEQAATGFIMTSDLSLKSKDSRSASTITTSGTPMSKPMIM